MKISTGNIITCKYSHNSMNFIIGDFKGALCLIDYVTRESNISIHSPLEKSFNARCMNGETELLNATKQQLDEYFNGVRKEFDLPVIYQGTTFQERVWDAIRKVPYGKTISYKDIAESINHPKAVRAVGTATGNNRLSIVIPCHRILQHSGKLGGYAGGIANKQELLNLEKLNT